MDAIMVLMQVGQPGDWTDRGVPEVVAGYDRAAGPVEAGAEWMFDHYPTPIGDNWRLLVWVDVRGKDWHYDNPDGVVTPALYRAAIADRGGRGAHSRRRRPKLQPAPITHKVRVDQVGIGDMVLITKNRRNAAAPSTGGPWYVADRVETDCVAARIRGVGVTTRDNGDTIMLRTALGDIGELPGKQPVIPVGED